MGDSYQSFYNGGASSFSKNYGQAEGSFIGYASQTGERVSAGTIGSPTSIQTANQLKEVISRIKEGVKNVELQPLQEGVFEQIPRQHFEEMRALMKLSGVKPSVHAPIFDPSGFGQQGYHESTRVENERKLFNVLERAKDLNPHGNIPVVMHSTAGLPGNEYAPGKDNDRFHLKKITLVDKETGQLAAEVKEERKYYPGHPEDFKDEGTLTNPVKQISVANESKWDQTMTGLAQFTKMTDEIIGSNPEVLAKYMNEQVTDELLQSMAPNEQAAYQKLNNANIFLQNAQLNFSSAFNTAYKYGTAKQKDDLKVLAEEYKENSKSAHGIAGVAMQRQILDTAIRKLDATTQKYGAPVELVSAEEFGREQAAKTFGNLAYNSFSKLGKGDASKAPMIVVENMYQGMAFSRAEDMAKLVDDSRDVFVKNATDKGMNESEAKKAAEKLIGVNWDVGHLNIMKKAGFNDEDVVKETAKIKDYVKHVHLTDNFGYSDSHLAPGMGNVPIKKILEELEKTGRLGEMSKIVEAGAFVQHFGKSPHSITMAALGASSYGKGGGPYWNQVSSIPTGGGYFGGPMSYLPEKHFSMYGTGFSSLPSELGGQMPGTQSRFSGTPTA